MQKDQNTDIIGYRFLRTKIKSQRNGNSAGFVFGLKSGVDDIGNSYCRKKITDIIDFLNDTGYTLFIGR